MAQQGGGDKGGGAGGGGGGGVKKPSPVHHNCVITHGTVMGLAFAFLMPLGAILIRVASFRGLIWVHAGIQAFAYVLAWVGLGLGIYIAVYPTSQVSMFGSCASIWPGNADCVFLLDPSS